jgi:hypothetical protein
MEIITRANALSQGLKHYFTGKPCKHNHICGRITSSRICIECNRVNRRLWYAKHPKQDRDKSKAYRRKNKEIVNARKRLKYDTMKDVWNARSSESRRKLYERDPSARIPDNLRTRIRKSLTEQGAYKTATTEALLGCSIAQCRVHLEKQFQDGMSWDNYGEWHIDHIRPCASFDLLDPEQQAQCFHYTNLQPLWAVDNLRKGANYQ